MMHDTTLFRPWDRILNTWNVIVTKHPGYRAWSTYDQVKNALQPFTSKPGSYVFRLSVTRPGQWVSHDVMTVNVLSKRRWLGGGVRWVCSPSHSVVHRACWRAKRHFYSAVSPFEMATFRACRSLLTHLAVNVDGPCLHALYCTGDWVCASWWSDLASDPRRQIVVSSLD